MPFLLYSTSSQSKVNLLRVFRTKINKEILDYIGRYGVSIEQSAIPALVGPASFALLPSKRSVRAEHGQIRTKFQYGSLTWHSFQLTNIYRMLRPFQAISFNTDCSLYDLTKTSPIISKNPIIFCQGNFLL